MEFRARFDRSLVRAGVRSRRVVRVEVTAPEAAPGAERPGLALSIVLDRSGSMGGKKLDLARQAAASAIRSLSPGDRFAVVVYDDRVDVLQASVDVSPQAVDAASRTIERVTAGGSTDLHGGWEQGCREAFGSLSEQRLARVLLLSDGLANQGLTDRAEISRQASDRRVSGVTTSTFGVGADYDEGLLSAMAEAGGGNFRFVATAEEIPQYVSDEVSEALGVAIPEAEISVRGPEGLEVECPNGFPVRQEDGSSRVAIGSLVSEQRLSVLLDVRFPPAAAGDVLPVRFELLSRGQPAGTAPVELAFTAASHAENDRQPADADLRRERARLEELRCTRRALELNREGDREGARALVTRTSERLRLHAGGDPEVLAIAARLRALGVEVSRSMDPRLLKMRHAGVYYSLKGRAMRGVILKESPLRTMTMSGRGLLAALEESADAFRSSRRPVFQGYAELLEMGELPEDWDERAPLPPDEEARVAERLRSWFRIEMARVLVLVTRRPLADGWFSHWHPAHDVAIASVAGLAEVTAVPPAAFVAYETFLHGLRERGIVPERVMHPEDRGCLYDFCADRAGLDRKLREATFCDDCRRVLAEAGLYPEPASAIADVIRALATGSSVAVN